MQRRAGRESFDYEFKKFVSGRVALFGGFGKKCGVVIGTQRMSWNLWITKHPNFDNSATGLSVLM